MPRSWATHWVLQGQTIQPLHMSFPYLVKAEHAELAEAIRARNVAVNSLGNLTLLNKYLNPAASNGGFDLKCDEYRHSVLRLNRHFDGKTEWDEQAIRGRGKTLGEMICKIWPRPQSVATEEHSLGLTLQL